MPTDQTKITQNQVWRRHSDGRLFTITDASEVERGHANARVTIQGARRSFKLVKDFRRECTYVGRRASAGEDRP